MISPLMSFEQQHPFVVVQTDQLMLLSLLWGAYMRLSWDTVFVPVELRRPTLGSTHLCASWDPEIGMLAFLAKGWAGHAWGESLVHGLESLRA